MKKYTKRFYFYLKEQYAYRKYFKKLGITFAEYSGYINNMSIDDDSSNSFTTVLFDKKIERITSYCYMQCIMEIFIDNIYKFDTPNKAPYIIDCGANMGLSIIYFKRLYPDAKIVAFEADPNMSSMCERNVKQFGLKDVEVINAAVWNEDGYMSFLPNDSLGGKLEDVGDSDKTVQVKTLRLLPYLTKYVDFLKIDIEGAEVDVLVDIKDALNNVGTLFVEYHSTVSEPQRLSTLLEVLSNAGYRYYIQEAFPLMPHPFLDHKNKAKFAQNVFDLQLNIFAYRL